MNACSGDRLRSAPRIGSFMTIPKVCLCLLTLASTLFPLRLMAESVGAIAFTSAPLMGESKYSKEGLQIDLLRAVMSITAMDLTVEILPRARANVKYQEGHVPIFLGPTQTLTDDFRKHVTEIPLFVVQNVVFYKKAKFPQFSFKQYSDLKKYSIGVLRSGASEKIGAAYGLKFDRAPAATNLMKKLDADRTELAIAVDLAGMLTIEELFPDRANTFDYYKETPFLLLRAQIIVNNDYPQAKSLIEKMRAGLRIIYANGTWLKIMEKYYGTGNVPERSKRLVEDYIKSM